MNQRLRQIASNALAHALDVRQRANIAIIDPVNVYDLAERLEVEVRFTDIPSMEGMYLKQDRPVILISSLRPSGRQAWTGGHEFGHHEFKHGTQIDELLTEGGNNQGFDQREFLVDCFSGFLLMPKSAVSNAFTLRQWDIRTCTDIQVYTIAGWLGVGYSTLLQHMSNTLELISRDQAQRLKRSTPKSIRSQLLGKDVSENVVLVDRQWFGRAIDLQAGDFILLPAGTISEGLCIEQIEQNNSRADFRGVTPGQGRLFHPDSGWSALVRVSRRNYVGLNKFRYLEECDEE